MQGYCRFKRGAVRFWRLGEESRYAAGEACADGAIDRVERELRLLGYPAGRGERGHGLTLEAGLADKERDVMVVPVLDQVAWGKPVAKGHDRHGRLCEL